MEGGQSRAERRLGLKTTHKNLLRRSQGHHWGSVPGAPFPDTINCTSLIALPLAGVRPVSFHDKTPDPQPQCWREETQATIGPLLTNLLVRKEYFSWTISQSQSFRTRETDAQIQSFASVDSIPLVDLCTTLSGSAFRVMTSLLYQVR